MQKLIYVLFTLKEIKMGFASSNSNSYFQTKLRMLTACTDL